MGTLSTGPHLASHSCGGSLVILPSSPCSHPGHSHAGRAGGGPEPASLGGCLQHRVPEASCAPHSTLRWEGVCGPFSPAGGPWRPGRGPIQGHQGQVCAGESPLLQGRVGASHAPSLDGPGVSTLGASRANRICSSGSSGACSPAYGHLRNHSLLLPGRGAGQMRAFRINFISIFIPEWVSTRERSRMKN